MLAIFRMTSADVEIQGRRIRSGSMALAAIGVANREVIVVGVCLLWLGGREAGTTRWPSAGRKGAG